MKCIKIEAPCRRGIHTNTMTRRQRKEDVLAIIEELSEFWPLTVRSVYYRVISSERYRADHWRSKTSKRIKKDISNPSGIIGDLIKHLRLDGRLSWGAINDESRIVTLKFGSEDIDNHVLNHLSRVGIPQFDQCLATDQPNYVEVWVEKNGLVHIAEPIADLFSRRVCGCKGHPSVSFLHSYSVRARQAIDAGQDCKILYFGDLDPSGWEIPRAFAESLDMDFDLGEVEVLRYGLNPSDIDQDDRGITSIALRGAKELKDRFIAETGLDVGYELDALSPGDFQDRVRGAIEEHTNMEALKHARAKTPENDKKISRWNSKVKSAIAPVIKEYRTTAT